MNQNTKELQDHLDRNKKMWEIWKQYGVDPETELTINFHFYAAKKENMELLCGELESDNIQYDIKETKTLFFLRGWEISANIKKKWTLPDLQGKTGNLFIMAIQTGVSLEGCGALMPK